MKIALLADIHGNWHALEAVLEDIRRERPDKIIVLGDLVFKGPLPQTCVQAVRAMDTTVLQGNIDELVGKGIIQPGFTKSPEHEETVRKEMAWTRAQLTQDELDYLAGLPFDCEEELSPAVTLRCVHANPRNLLDIVLPTSDEASLEQMFEGTNAKVVAYAHIHQPYIRYVNGRTVINTGSVGLPFDGDSRASYAVLEAEGDSYSASIRRVHYDVEAAVRAFENSGHPFAESVIIALRAGRRPV